MDTANLQDALAQGAESANELKDRVASRASDLAAAAREATEEVDDDTRGKGGLLLLVVAVAAVAAFLLKRKREQELDEALWEEPRAL